MVHSHLAHALANRLDVTRIAETEALNAGSNFRLGLLIRKTRQPIVEFVGLLNLEHLVSYRIQDCRSQLVTSSNSGVAILPKGRLGR